MAKRVSKNVLRAAKSARQDKYNEELEALHTQRIEAAEAGDHDRVNEIWNNIEELEQEFFGAQRDRRNTRAAAKAEMRDLKRNMSDRDRRGRPKIQWASPEAKLEQRASRKKKVELAQVEEVGLMRAHRMISRWEIEHAPRGIDRGEIMMVISETYNDYNNKPRVDVMVGADVFKGVPATALRRAVEE